MYPRTRKAVIRIGSLLAVVLLCAIGWIAFSWMHHPYYTLHTITDAQKLVLQGSGLVDINQLIGSITALTQRHRDAGWHAPHVVGRQILPHDRLIVVANIQGGLVELYNYLEHWHTQGIIDNTFTLTDAQTHIVFVGSVLGGSGRLLSTLAIIVRLMEQNPGRVLYAPAPEEFEGLSYLQPLRDELKESYSSFHKALIPLLTNWYNTLPEAVYVYTQSDAEQRYSGPMVISSYRDYIELNREQWLGDFLSNLLPTEWKSFHIDQPQASKTKIHIRVALDASPAGLRSLPHRQDVSMILPVRAATVWRVWSCAHAARLSQENEKHGAYAILNFGSSWATSDICAYRGQAEYRAPIALQGRYVLTSGRPLAQDQLIDRPLPDIQIGCSLDLSKSNRAMGHGICAGIAMAINECNAAGGVGGRMIHPIILDDGYVPARARQNIDVLLDHLDCPIIVLPVGSPTLEAAADLLHTDSMCVFFPVTGSPSFRSPDMKAVVTYRPSFQLESKVLVEYLLKQQMLNFAFFYQDDEYGTGVLERARKILKSSHIDQWIELPYARNATQFKGQVDQLRKSQVEALGIFGSSQQAQEFLRQLGAEVLSSMQLFANSFTVDAAFEHFVRYVLGIPFISTRLVPDPAHDMREITRDYRAAMDTIGWPYEDNSIEAYITMSLLCHLMREVGPAVTHRQLMEKVESLDHYEYKGFTWTFDPEIRELRKEINIWIDFQNGMPWQPIEMTEKR